MRDTSAAAFIHPTAVLMGDVVVGEGSSIWAGAVVKGDAYPVRIGRYSNVQENTVIHVAYTPTDIGDYVCIAHGAVVHSRAIENEVTVGMNATLLEGSVIRRGSVIGANALVLENAIVPPNSLVIGVPGRVKEQHDGAQLTRGTALFYYEVAVRQAQGEETFSMDEVMAEVQRRMAQEEPEGT